MPTHVFVNALNQFRQVTAKHVWVSALNSWRVVHRSYVHIGNGVWKLAFARTPSPPTIATLYVGGSTVGNQTTVNPTVPAEVQWAVQTAESGLPTQVQWYMNGTTYGSPVNISSGTSDTETFPVPLGGQISIYATVKVRNGDSLTVDAQDVYSSATSSTAIIVARQQPTITNLTLSRDAVANTITATFTPNNAPVGAQYALLWRANYYDNPADPQSRPSQTTQKQSSTTLFITSAEHGYDIQENISDAYATFYVTVRMYLGTDIIASSAEDSITVAVG